MSSSEAQLMRLKHFDKDKKIDELLTVYQDYSYLFLKKLSFEEDFSDEDSVKLQEIEEKKNNLERYLSPKLRQYAQTDYMTSDNIVEELEKDELYIDFVQADNSYYFFLTPRHPYKKMLNLKESKEKDGTYRGIKKGI